MKYKLINKKYSINLHFFIPNFLGIGKSFTLIELLVVVAIIGTLSAFLVPNFMGARERARDAQRKNDIKQIQKALEMYRQDQITPGYPTPTGTTYGTALGACGSSFTSSVGLVYLNKIPCDPMSTSTSKKDYYYALDSNLGYVLCACLENSADPDAGSGSCGVLYICSGAGGGKKYSVNEP